MVRKLPNVVILLMVILLPVFTGCSSDSSTAPDGEEGPAITRVWIEGSLGLVAGNSGQMQAYVLLEDGTTHDVTNEATWETLDPSKATVNQGMVTTIEAGRSDLRIRYRGTTFTDPFFVYTRAPGVGEVKIEGGDLNNIIQFSVRGETRQLVATVRLPDATDMDVSDRVLWEASNPEAISVSDFGIATVNVSTGASELYVHWRGRYGSAVLQVGAPLPKEYQITVEPFRIYAAYSCDSATNEDGGDGEFSYEINIVLPTGTRVPVAGTVDYPSEYYVVIVDQNANYNLPTDQTSITLTDIQNLEVEVRLTEWDLEFVDFGDPVPDGDMDDQSDTKVYRGSAGFSPGLHTITLAGPSGDCEIEISYYVIAVEN
ncbi:MAG TPA: hypothetical protein VEC56_09645 [Candidatus Krumholzibacteria bacterium]|nr:hypothetical protein [Candidatus Krumholzibacteria bacterium]